MKYNKSAKKLKSLGTLRVAKKTKDRSPDLTGALTILDHTLAEIVKQFKESGKDGVPCNIAAWRNTDKNGAPYLSVELSPWFVTADRNRPELDIFDSLFNDRNEDE